MEVILVGPAVPALVLGDTSPLEGSALVSVGLSSSAAEDLGLFSLDSGPASVTTVKFLEVLLGPGRLMMMCPLPPLEDPFPVFELLLPHPEDPWISPGFSGLSGSPVLPPQG